mgnify:CR=1 FL=1
MKKYVLAVMLVIIVRSIAVAGYGDVPDYEQKPHLELICPCGARFTTYEWLEGAILRRADKFIEAHPCSHDTRLPEKVCTIIGTTSNWKEYKQTLKNDDNFYEGQKVWDVLRGRGTVEEVENGHGTMSIEVKLNSGLRLWYHENGSYDDKEVRRLYPIETKSINFTLDKLFPEKKQERLLVRELIGSETVGLQCYNFVVTSNKYSCVRCGKLLGIAFGNGNYFCPNCKKYFNIEKGE